LKVSTLLKRRKLLARLCSGETDNIIVTIRSRDDAELLIKENLLPLVQVRPSSIKLFTQLPPGIQALLAPRVEPRERPRLIKVCAKKAARLMCEPDYVFVYIAREDVTADDVKGLSLDENQIRMAVDRDVSAAKAEILWNRSEKEPLTAVMFLRFGPLTFVQKHLEELIERTDNIALLISRDDVPAQMIREVTESHYELFRKYPPSLLPRRTLRILSKSKKKSIREIASRILEKTTGFTAQNTSREPLG